VSNADRPASGSSRPRRGTPEARAERLARHAAETEPSAVLAAAMRLLEVRSRTVSDLRGRLIRSGYPAGFVDGAVDRLVELGLLDDEAYARQWLQSRDRARPRGERVLRQELRLRGVPQELAAAALQDRRDGPTADAGDAGSGRQAHDEGQETLSADESAARSLVHRRAAALARIADPRVRRQRAYALLSRNGFDPDVAGRVASRLDHLGADDLGEADPE
jgi:SOS response regulatory protein OraA/RecX